MSLARARAALGRVGGDQRGFTFPELLVGMMISMIVIGAGLFVLQTILRQQPGLSDRAGQIQQGRVLIEQITHELRQGDSVISGSTGSTLQILTYVHNSSAACNATPSETGPATPCRVTYSCSGSTCTRTEINANGTVPTPANPPRKVAEGLTSTSTVFTYSPSATNPSYIGVKLVFPDGDGGAPFTIEDGVWLRNHVGLGT